MKKTYIWGWPKYKDDLELKTTWFGRLYIARVYTTLVVLVRLQWTPCPPLLAAFLGHFHPENILKRNSNHMKPISVKGRQTPPTKKGAFLSAIFYFGVILIFNGVDKMKKKLVSNMKKLSNIKMTSKLKTPLKMKTTIKIKTTAKQRGTQKWRQAQKWGQL